MRRLLCLCALLGACSSLPPDPAPSPEPVQPPAPEPGTMAPAPQPRSDTRPLPPARSGSLLGKIDQSKLREQLRQAPKAINIQHRCSFRNETGYNGSTRVTIVNNEVKELATRISVPLAGGSCNFEGSGFRQTTRSPSIEMRHADGCTVRIWSQGRQLSIAYSNCAARCNSAETFKYIWPVLIDQSNGQCH